MGLQALLQNEFTCEVFFCKSIYSAPKCVGLGFEVCMCGNRNNGGKTKKQKVLCKFFGLLRHKTIITFSVLDRNQILSTKAFNLIYV